MRFVTSRTSTPGCIRLTLAFAAPTTNSYRRLVSGSLAEAVDALENDYKFLTAGNVFTDDLVEMWIKWKREEELDSMALWLHPYEFHPYYDS